MKPYYDDGRGIQIYHGDCREILPTLPIDSAIVSDPPYGISYVHSGGGLGKHNRRNLNPILGDETPFDPLEWLVFSEVILWGADHYAPRLPEGKWLVWDKLNGLPSFDSFSDVEIAWCKKAGASRIFRYLWKGICRAGDIAGGRQHPSQKPLPLMKWCIEQTESSTIIDPFMGSGTTLRAAKDLGRKAIGIELEERYCDAAALRLQQEVLPFTVETKPQIEQSSLALAQSD